MSKVKVSYRLEDYTIVRLEKLAKHFSENANVTMPGQKSKVSKTDVLEYLINAEYERLEKFES